jgi:hypothetical protein
MRDISKIIRRMHAKSSSLKVELPRVPHPGAEEQAVWKFTQPPNPLVIQIESPDGMCPFLIESSQGSSRLVGTSVPEVVDLICQLLKFPSSSA